MDNLLIFACFIIIWIGYMKILDWHEERKRQRWMENPEEEEAKQKEYDSKPWYKKSWGVVFVLFGLFLFYTFFIKESRVYKPGIYDGKFDSQVWVD